MKRDSKKTKEDSSDVQKIVQEDIPSSRKTSGSLAVQMTMNDGKNEWNFQAQNPIDAIVQGKKLCAEHGFRWPQDVIAWEFS